MTELPHIPFPFDLARIGSPLQLARLGCAEYGAALRVAEAAWDRGGMIETSSLAAIAGMGREEWASVAPRVLLAVMAVPGEPNGHVVHLRAVINARRELLEARNQKRAAGKASAAKRAQAPPPTSDRQRPFNGRSTVVQRPLESALAGPERGPRAPGREALERSDQEINLPERSSARTAEFPTAPQLAGAIFAGLEDKTIARILAWRKARIIDILTVACEGWDKAKRFLPNDWRDMVHKAACDPKVEPALAQIAVNRADVPEVQNPLAYAVSALGVRKGGKKLEPHLSDQGVIDLWVQRERIAFQVQKSILAAEEASRRITQHAEEARRAGGVA